MSGNNVSHAQNKTRRKFLPNIQDTGVYSEALGRLIKVRASTHGLRTIEHKGGLDAYLVKTASSKLDPSLRLVKAKVEKVIAATTAAK